MLEAYEYIIYSGHLFIFIAFVRVQFEILLWHTSHVSFTDCVFSGRLGSRNTAMKKMLIAFTKRFLEHHLIPVLGGHSYDVSSI